MHIRRAKLTVNKSGMDIRQGQIVFGGKFIRVNAQPFVPDHNALNRNAAPGDMRLPPRHSRQKSHLNWWLLPEECNE